VSAAAFPAEQPAEVAEYLGRYRTRYYANGYALTYEYVVMAEDADAGLQVEYRQLAAEALGDDVAPLAGVPTWVITHTDDPDGRPVSEHAERRDALATHRAPLAAQAVE
jgi:hypothetical protein